MDIPRFKYQALSGPNQIRVVTICPGTRETAIGLQLEQVDIDSGFAYECLSYAWGTEDHDRPVTLDNASFSVSSTLHTALKHLRHELQERKIWIDAISINQTDIAERSGQVAIMRKIYQNATRVNVWLGPATESSEQAIAFLEMMGTSKTIQRGGLLDSVTSSSFRGCEDRPEPACVPKPRYEESDSEEKDSEKEKEKEEDGNEREQQADRESEGPCIEHCPLPNDEVASLVPAKAEARANGNSQLLGFANVWKGLREFLRRFYRWVMPNSEDRSSHDDFTSYVLARQDAAEYRKRQSRSSPTLWTNWKDYLWLSCRPIRLRYKRRLMRRAAHQRAQAYVDAVERAQATKNDFAVTGIPVLFYEFHDRTCDKYFGDEWESHWQALDELLARPWWSRTWIVQEVWSSSDVVLQCGTSMIDWKTVQQAMEYTEAWDDMGEFVKGTKREPRWDTLRRRYTLAIHLTTARLNGSSTLSSLLWNTWDRASTDPRDKVFAMLALVDKSAGLSLSANYGKSVEEVYKEAARDIILKQDQMDILLAASGVGGTEGLPSWVPDWRCEANAKKPVLLVNRHLLMKLACSGSMDMAVLDGHGYRAAGNTKASASFSDNLNVLTVLGKNFDSIAEVCEADVAVQQDDEFTEHCSAFAIQSKFVLAEIRNGELKRKQSTIDSSSTSTLLTTLAGGGTEDRDRWAPTIRNIMRGRRLFITRRGHIGIASTDIQPNDVVYIISGCNFPIVLRPEKDKFAVVGEAYSELLAY